MNDDHPTPEDTSSDADEERDGHGEEHCLRTDSSGEESAAESASGVGITDDDMAQIRSFLQKQRHRRSVDDLRPSSRQ